MKYYAFSAAGRLLSSALLFSTAAIAIFSGSTSAEAKILGGTHCYFGICHRVKTIAETQKLVGVKTTVKASFYDDCKVDRFNPCTLTSSGEVFKPDRPDNAASPIYPDGTKLLVWNPKTKSAAIVRVNSAGPYHSNRTLDVSRATAERLGFKKSGVASLQVQVIEAPTAAEARYKKHRTYAAVPGPIGKFQSFELATADLGRIMPALDTSRMIASITVPTPVTLAASRIDNAKAAKTAGHNATIAAIASVGGGPGLTTAFSASAILMNSVPHSLLPSGVLMDVKIRTVRTAGKPVAVTGTRKAQRIGGTRPI
jgi:rare lipoprotein A (peptidoglycan hydrolase)